MPNYIPVCVGVYSPYNMLHRYSCTCTHTHIHTLAHTHTHAHTHTPMHLHKLDNSLDIFQLYSVSCGIMVSDITIIIGGAADAVGMEKLILCWN